MKSLERKIDRLARLIEKGSLILLNQGPLSIRYVHQLVAFKTTNVKSTRGQTLPIEVWNMILKIALDDSPDDPCFVQLVSTQDQPEFSMLHCRTIKWEQPGRFGDIDSGSEVLEYEEFLENPNEENCARVGLPPIEPVDENKIDVLLTSIDSQLPLDSVTLYTDLTVPDVICWMENGHCSFCGGSRNICPGCTRGRAQEFDAFMGCGVDLACPLCMGYDFCMEHKGFLKRYYWDDAPEEEQRAMDNRLVQRLNKFGYQWAN